MSKCKIFLVRHGESIHNVEALNSGHSDPALTETGRRQAVLLKTRLSKIHFDEVYSSDLERAIETAMIIFGGSVPKSHQVPELRERNFGSLEGLPAKHRTRILELHEENHGKLSSEQKWVFKNVPDMESDSELAQRFIRAVKTIAAKNSGKTILIAAHGGTLRTLLIAVGHGTFDDYSSGAIKNASFIELTYDGESLTVDNSKDALG